MNFIQLKPNDTIGVMSFSDQCEDEHIEIQKKAKKYFESKNINIVLGNSIYKTNNEEQNIENKLQDFENLINNAKINLIISTKGGTSCDKIFDKLNYSKIKNKSFMGFSDNTLILNAIYAKTGIPCYHFVNYNDFGKENNEFNIEQFEKAFLSNKKYDVSKMTDFRIINEGRAKGELIGGNLSVFMKLLGTEYCPDLENKILVLEDLIWETSEEQLEINFNILKKQGVFNKVKGLVLGNYSSDKISIEEIAKKVIGPNNIIPIIKTEDIGHGGNNIVVPIGMGCIIDTKNKIIEYKEQKGHD